MTDDICIVFNKDAPDWPNYIMNFLDRQLKIHSKLDTEVLSRPLAAPSAAVYIVIATTGHIDLLKENRAYSYKNTVKDATKAVLFLCGVQLSAFDELDDAKESLTKRFPEMTEWKVVDYNNTTTIKGIVAKLLAKPQTQPKLKVASPTTAKPIIAVPAAAPQTTVAKSTAVHAPTKPKVSEASKALPKAAQQIKIYPTSLRSEEATIVTISFNEPIPLEEKSSATNVTVVISSVDGRDSYPILLQAEWINPYTFTFTAPEQREGEVTVKVVLNGTDVGKDHTLNYVSQAGLITDITQIYMHQLCKCCDLMLVKKNISVTELDNCLTSLFNLDAGMADIPGQAFEQLFGIYKHMKDDKVDVKIPTLIHFAARYGLQELCSKLIDLPDSSLANSIFNSDGKLPEELAKANKHVAIASFLESNREIEEESFENVYVQYCGYVNADAGQVFDKHGYLRAQKTSATLESEGGYMTMGAKQLRQNDSGTDEKIYTSVLDEDEEHDAYDYTAIRGPVFHRKTIIPIPDPNAAQPPKLGRVSTVNQPQRKESDYSAAKPALSSSQQKLVEIMEMVKRKELTVVDAELMFKQWQMEYKGGSESKSFKEKQQQLEKMREEVKRAKNQTNVYGALIPGPSVGAATSNQRSSSASNDSRDSTASVGSRASRTSTSGIETDDEPIEPFRFPSPRQPQTARSRRHAANETPAPALPPPRTKK